MSRSLSIWSWRGLAMRFFPFPPSPSHTTPLVAAVFFCPKQKEHIQMCAKSEQWRTLFNKQISNICPTSVRPVRHWFYFPFIWVCCANSKRRNLKLLFSPLCQTLLHNYAENFWCSEWNLKETKVKKTQKHIKRTNQFLKPFFWNQFFETNFWNQKKSFENDLIIIFLHH